MQSRANPQESRHRRCLYLAALVVQRLAAVANALLTCSKHYAQSQPQDSCRNSAAPSLPRASNKPKRTSLAIRSQRLERRTCAQRTEVLHGLGHHLAEQAHGNAAWGNHERHTHNVSQTGAGRRQRLCVCVVLATSLHLQACRRSRRQRTPCG